MSQFENQSPEYNCLCIFNSSLKLVAFQFETTSMPLTYPTTLTLTNLFLGGTTV